MKHFHIILFSFCAFSVTAQNYVDILKVSWDEGAAAPYETGSGEASFREYVVDATMPLVLKSGNALLTGFMYERTEVNASESFNDLMFQGLALKMGLNWKHSDKWSGTYLLLPKISADELSLQSDAIQLGLIVILKNTIGENRNFKLGFYSNTELFGPFLVPLLGYYQIDEKKEINIMAPLSAEFFYRFTENTKAGINFKGIIKSYHLSDSPQYLTKANNEVSLSFQSQLNKVLFSLDAGRTIGRDIRTYNNGAQLGFALSALKIADERVQQNTDFEDSWFLKAGIALRFSTD